MMQYKHVCFYVVYFGNKGPHFLLLLIPDGPDCVDIADNLYTCTRNYITITYHCGILTLPLLRNATLT